MNPRRHRGVDCYTLELDEELNDVDEELLNDVDELELNDVDEDELNEVELELLKDVELELLNDVELELLKLVDEELLNDVDEDELKDVELEELNDVLELEEKLLLEELNDDEEELNELEHEELNELEELQEDELLKKKSGRSTASSPCSSVSISIPPLAVFHCWTCTTRISSSVASSGKLISSSNILPCVTTVVCITLPAVEPLVMRESYGPSSMPLIWGICQLDGTTAVSVTQQFSITSTQSPMASPAVAATVITLVT